MSTRTARQLFDAFEACAKEKDAAAIGDLFAENATMELPFLPGGGSLRLEGRDEIRMRAMARWADSPLSVESFHPLGIALGRASSTGETRSPREVLRLYHAAMIAKSADALADLYALDGTHESPFFTPNQPPRREGREAIREAYRRGWSDHPLQIERIEDVFVHEGDDREVVVGQWRARATLRATGRDVEITGLLVLRVQNGLIVHTRDFMDALGIAKALGREPFARA